MDDRHRKLKKLLHELAKNIIENEEEMNSYVNKLEEIYQNNFRHLYSIIFATITEIDDENPGDITNLIENIREIYEHVKSDKMKEKYTESFIFNVQKLYDHVNLDVARVEYTKSIANQINEKNSATNNELKKVGQKAEQMQKDYITILGIFSSVIIAFVAGITFSTSVLSNMDRVSVYRLSFVMIMTAMMLFNLLNFLLEFLKEINNESFKCHEPNKKNTSLIGFINTILFLMLLGDIIAWWIYWWRVSENGW